MKELFEKAEALYAAFKADAEKCIAGNKAAGARARKTSIELTETLKAFRKASVPKKED